MKKKINSSFLLLVAAAILLTMSLTTVLYYRTFETEVMDDLCSYTHILEETKVFEDVKNRDFGLQLKNVRVTVIQPDGTVMYDSDADVGKMENHMDRPEIIDAFEIGEGKAIRESSTLSKNTFYYAIKMDNGAVLRVSKEAGSIWSIFKSAFPVISSVTVLLFFICLCVAHALTVSILQPIKEISKNLDNMENVSTYKEIMPFIKVIHRQHQDILKSAKMRQEFTANVSHELKTPLTSISGYSELIENGMATEADITRFAGEIHRSSQRLLSLINDILKLSELDSKETELDMEEVNLLEVAEECKGMLSLHAEENEVEISVEGESAIVQANKKTMEEVIFNLCDNAIRYNRPGGHVWISIHNKEKEVEVIVRDDGIGIPQKDQNRIFERFYRVDKSRSKKTGGTGLGLAIVKHIVEQHGAEISVDSEEGKGTSIKVIFKN